MTNGNGNNTGNNILKWLMGIFSALVMFFVFSLHNRLSSIEQVISEHKADIATLTEKIKQAEGLAIDVNRDRNTRTEIIADIKGKILQLQNEVSNNSRDILKLFSTIERQPVILKKGERVE